MMTVGDIVGDNAFIEEKDRFKRIGKPSVLQRPTVFPFFYQITIADSTSSSENFPELQNTELVEFNIESNGELTITSNIFSLLKLSEDLLLNGKFGLQVPTGTKYPISRVPKISWTNNSGGSRKLSFFGWVAPYAKEF